MNSTLANAFRTPSSLAGRSTLRRYGFAFAATALAFIIRLLLEPVLAHSQIKHIFITFIVATILVAWYSGFVPSLLTFIVGFLLADYFFLDPKYSLALDANQYLNTMLPPILVSLTVILFGRSM